MISRDKFNSTINRIESMIQENPYEKASSISRKVAAHRYMSERDLSAVFSYLTGQTLMEYIRNRKMVAVYKKLIESENVSLDKLIEMANVGDQAAFSKKFKKFCGMTVLEAKSKKDLTPIVEPCTWDELTKEVSKTRAGMSKSMITETKFGIDVKLLKKVTEASDLQKVYGFDEYLSETAFQLAERYQSSMRDAFEFIDDFTIRYDLIQDDGRMRISHSQFEKMLVAADAVIYLCLQLHLSVNEAFELYHDIHRVGKNVREIDTDTLHYYLHSSLTLPEILQAEDNFDPKGHPIDPEAYMERIEEGYSPEDAVDSIIAFEEMP